MPADKYGIPFIGKDEPPITDTEFQEMRFLHHMDEFQAEVHGVAQAHGWWEGNRNEAEVLALIHSEVSESLEILRISPDKISDRSRKDLLGEELADIIIRVMDYAAFKDISLGDFIIAKNRKNRDRPYKHGKKF